MTMKRRSVRLLVVVSCATFVGSVSGAGPFGLSAQTPATSAWLGCATDPCQATGRPAPGVSDNNPWIKFSLQFAYSFAGTGNVDAVTDLFSARTELVKPEIKGIGLALPIISNLGSLSTANAATLLSKIQSLVAANSGLSVAFAPYWPFPHAESAPVVITLFGTAGWRLNSVKDTSGSGQTRALNEGRFSLGVDALFYVFGSAQTGHLPISLSAEPVLTVFSKGRYHSVTGDNRSRLQTVELTAMSPLPFNGLGLLIQGVPIRDFKPMWRAGLIYYLKKS